MRVRQSSHLALLLLGLLTICGCGPRGPRTYPVQGRVELPGGEIKNLAGSHVEAALASDTNVRASGIIQEDGSFVLETLHSGQQLKGAVEGSYQVRIILNDEDGPSKRRAARAIDPRFLQFKSSGLALQVPPPGEVTLKVAPR